MYLAAESAYDEQINKSIERRSADRRAQSKAIAFRHAAINALMFAAGVLAAAVYIAT